MHIAIDDTYGPETSTNSLFVTGSRRSHVAVLFPDEDVEDIRSQAVGCLNEVCNLTGVSATEFHFVDIYNRKRPWDKLVDRANLKIFAFFAEIYRHYKWPIVIQTIDKRTLSDHGIVSFEGKIDGLDLSNTAYLSLLMLLTKIKNRFKDKLVPITLFVDEGREKPGKIFGSKIFHDWPASYTGNYASSSQEPLLQIADFIAFCVNRSTHLALKSNRSEVDTWFLNLVAKMQFDCDELKAYELPKNFTTDDFDKLHLKDRIAKGL